MILVFYAFGRELVGLRRRLARAHRLAQPGLRGFSGSLGGVEIIAVATGIGAGNARAAAHRAFSVLPRPDLVLVTGVVGALRSVLATGDLILADRLLDARGPSGAPPTVIAVSEPTLARLGRALASSGLRFMVGGVLTVGRPLKDGAQKRRAGAETGALAVDMESAAVASEAAARGLEFACVRAVLDAVDEELIGAELAGSDGIVRPLQAAGFLLRNPGVIAKLGPLMRNLGRSTEALGQALEAVVRGFTGGAEMAGS